MGRMNDEKRRELGGRLRRAMRKTHGRLDPSDGGTMRAALEWARETTGRRWLAIAPAALGPGWVAVDDCGVVDGCDELHDTEDEAHVALVEWAAENPR